MKDNKRLSNKYLKIATGKRRNTSLPNEFIELEKGEIDFKILVTKVENTVNNIICEGQEEEFSTLIQVKSVLSDNEDIQEKIIYNEKIKYPIITSKDEKRVNNITHDGKDKLNDLIKGFINTEKKDENYLKDKKYKEGNNQMKYFMFLVLLIIFLIIFVI
jgi:hypothetical protein